MTRNGSVLLASNQQPRLHQLPRKAVASAGDDAIAWAESIGWDEDEGRGFYVLDEWQKYCIRGILSEDAGARLCALTVLLLVPRQNGKNVVLEVIELYAFFVLELRYILHSAHLAETSADHMARLWEAIQSDADLSSRCRQTIANGKERIYVPARTVVDEETGKKRREPARMIRFRTRSKKIGRGGSPQLAVFDEALHLTDKQQSGMLPSLSAQSTRKDKPIIVYTSSAPTDVDEAEVLLRIRAAILEGKMLDAFFAEWSCEPDPALDWNEGLKELIADRDALFAANPGMPERIDPDWVESVERPSMSVEDYCIERLGVIRPLELATSVIPNWDALAVEGSSIVSHSQRALFVSRDREWSAIGAAGRNADGRPHVEFVRHQKGTDWVLAHCVTAWNETKIPVRIRKSGAEKSFISLLRERGIEVVEVSTDEEAQATGQLLDAARAGQLVHLGQPSLNKALRGARLDVSAHGASVWSERLSLNEISALGAVTVAIGGVPSVKRKAEAWVLVD